MPTFQTPAPIAVTIDVPSGNVQVIASDRSETVVEIRPSSPAKKGDVRAAEQVQVDYTAGALTVTLPKAWRLYGPLSGNPSIEVIVEVPAGSHLKATAALGRLLITGEFGECDLEVAAGDITVDRPRGSVTAKTAKGDIRVGDAARGILRLTTSYGELEVGIRPGSAARVETNAQYGTVRNLMEPVGKGPGDTVQVFARNSYGNIVIRHTDAA
ncbi:DUF4097 family beta strand repeat-containing protein [Nocardia sp. NPDC051832]|uniref:DUF4097 family beta strand repeat-containing protein n=1 Tax=Nocardia sp. NPDC051832 TaxID=3155673 RepID=UPI0034400D0E